MASLNVSISLEQKRMMIEFLKKNNKLLTAKFDASFTRKYAVEKWTELANILNAIPGANKNWRLWRKAWQDLRCRTKGKISKAKKHKNHTGGGSSAPELDSRTETERDIEDMLGSTAINGHDTIYESEVLIECVYEDSFEYDGVNIDASTPRRTSTPTLINAGVAVTPIQAITSTTPTRIQDSDMAAYAENTLGVTSERRAKTKRRFATQRLEKTVTATSKLASTCEERNQIKNAYYEKKLKIMERNTLAWEKTAAACERNATAQENIAQATERMAGALEKFTFF